MRDTVEPAVLSDAELAKLIKVEEPKPALPVFKPRWWYKPNRLDARPVVWSLYNRPQEWERRGIFRLRHIPSAHDFWVANGIGFYSLEEAECSCRSSSERGKFQRFQQFTFHFAYKWWQRNHNPVDQKQFASHFVR